jgi:hypothetical protein
VMLPDTQPVSTVFISSLVLFSHFLLILTVSVCSWCPCTPPDQTRRHLGLRQLAVLRSSESGSRRPSRRTGRLGGQSASISTMRSTGCKCSMGSLLCQCWRIRRRTRRRRVTGSGPPLIGGNSRPHLHRPRGRPWDRSPRRAWSCPPPGYRWRYW